MLRSLTFVTAAALLAGCAGPSSSRLLAPRTDAVCAPAPARERLRVVSFNIRSGLSSSLSDIGELLAGMDADVIALQEVDVGCRRTGGVDQAGVLAERLGHQYAFASAMTREGGDYGVALLSRLPFQRVERVDLRASGSLEPRVAIDATLCAGAAPVRVVAVHADVLPWAAADNARALARSLARTLSVGGARVVVAGDLNAPPLDEGPRAFAQLGLADLVGLHAEGPTFHFAGARRLDYIFTDRALAEDATAGRVASQVSDHYPVHAELRWPTAL